jgi:hypothetical protein
MARVRGGGLAEGTGVPTDRGASPGPGRKAACARSLGVLASQATSDFACFPLNTVPG